MKSIKITKTDIVLFYIREYIKLSTLILLRIVSVFAIMGITALFTFSMGLGIFMYYFNDTTNISLLLSGLGGVVWCFVLLVLLSKGIKKLENNIKL